jgi:hypothetical protein
MFRMFPVRQLHEQISLTLQWAHLLCEDQRSGVFMVTNLHEHLGLRD